MSTLATRIYHALHDFRTDCEMGEHAPAPPGIENLARLLQEAADALHLANLPDANQEPTRLYSAEEEAAARNVQGEFCDEDGYPTEAALERIKTWILATDNVWQRPLLDGLLEFVRALWMYSADAWQQNGDHLDVSTYGWSGNEDIVDALQANFAFWCMCWSNLQRGGHYLFDLSKFKQEETPTP